MRIRDPKPSIHRLEELVAAVRGGDIRLPKFQRPFVWSRSDVTDLLDSIYNGYPIGSILLWHSSERLKSEREIIGFKLTEENAKEIYPTDYLLDGQQRLTSLCASLHWDGIENPSYWNICFDLDSDEFTQIKGDPQLNHFPINKLLDTSEFIRQCMRFQSSKHAAQYVKSAEALLSAFKNYQIAVVKIGDVSLEEVAPIFERINSTGRKLTMVDLMRAATWSDGFDLSEGIDQINAIATDLDIGNIGDSLIVRSIAATSGLGINKADIEKLRDKTTAELTLSINATKLATAKAVEFLQDRCRIGHLTFLPYQLQFSLIVEFFNNSKNNSEERIRTLEKWFWRTSISRNYSGATTGQISKHLDEMRKFANEEIEEPSFLEITLDPGGIIGDDFIVRNASTTVYSLLLKTKSPQTSLQGFPLFGTENAEKDKRLFGNISDVQNKYYSKNISRVFGTFKKTRNGRLPYTWDCDYENHFFDKASYEMLLNGDFDGAISSRIEAISKYILTLTEG